jgi:hypothetical protein
VLGCLIGGVLLLVIGPLTIVGILNTAGIGTAATYTVGFGTGGTGCELSTSGDTFPAGTEVRIVATFSPNLPAGSTVSVSMERNGTALPSQHVTIRVDEPMNCIHGTIPSLDAGHYRVLYESASIAGPISAEFDIVAE